jgi:hypothetical protein
VTAFINTPTRRLAAAIVVSVLLHAIIFYVPSITLPHEKVVLPAIVVRIVQNTPSKSASIVTPENVEPDHVIATPLIAESAVKPEVAMGKMHASKTNQPFPKNVQLKFVIYSGASDEKIGELSQQLKIDGGHYELRAIPTVTRFFGKIDPMQISQGSFSDQGFQPDTFVESDSASEESALHRFHFDWRKHALQLTNGDEVELPVNTQDQLSFMYQLSKITLNDEFFPLPIANGESITITQIEVGAMEFVDTKMGKIRARHLRKMHTRQEAYFEIWLAPEYRMLPVKFRQVSETGQKIKEYIIFDIRADDK